VIGTMGDKPVNFARVDNRVWRGARPSTMQAAELVADGVRTFLNLEWEQSDDLIIRDLGRDYERANRGDNIAGVRIRDFEPLPWFAPSITDEHVIRALCAIRQAGKGVVYVHCRSGENRTGVVVAAYRLIERGDSLPGVAFEFSQYRGFWAWGDLVYIRKLAGRRLEMTRRIGARLADDRASGGVSNG
jgi:hypothetical protein